MYFFNLYWNSLILNIENDNHTNCRNDKNKIQQVFNSKKGAGPMNRIRTMGAPKPSLLKTGSHRPT